MAETKAISKGPQLEEMLKAYFWQAGYFVVRSIPYRLDGEDVTDVDLWLYERPAASTRRRLIVDAKNKKSPRATERIIWGKGLQAALKVDGIIVATTDNRPNARKLAKSTDVILFDGDAVSKLMQSEKLAATIQIPSHVLDARIKEIDEGRRSADWRNAIYEARASLIGNFGIQSANQALRASAFFAEQAVLAFPNSEQAEVALRLFYSTSAFAAISLDYILADQAFRTQEDRRQSIINGIRFGQPEPFPDIVRAAVGLTRQYVENGAAIAKQIELGFFEDADRIPAEIIADYVARISNAESLFNIAREIERASAEFNLPAFDVLSKEAKSLLGVLLDFNGISREKLALSWDVRPKTGTTDGRTKVENTAAQAERATSAQRSLFAKEEKNG